MNKFLNTLKSKLNSTIHQLLNKDGYDEINGSLTSEINDLIVVQKLLSNLGPNATQMLNIGLIEDELYDLGFHKGAALGNWIKLNHSKYFYTIIRFEYDKVVFIVDNGFIKKTFLYSCCHWADDLLEYVKSNNG